MAIKKKLLQKRAQKNILVDSRMGFTMIYNMNIEQFDQKNGLRESYFQVIQEVL